MPATRDVTRRRRPNQRMDRSGGLPPVRPIRNGRCLFTVLAARSCVSFNQAASRKSELLGLFAKSDRGVFWSSRSGSGDGWSVYLLPARRILSIWFRSTCNDHSGCRALLACERCKHAGMRAPRLPVGCWNLPLSLQERLA